MPRIGVVGLLILLLVLQPISSSELLEVHQQSSSQKNSGVDLSATDVSISYSNPSDESQYKMFSSNHPILGFDRPKSLYVVDSVNATPMDIEVTVRNDGNIASGIITVNLLILHNEYERFELANRTVTMNSLAPNGQGTATFYNVFVNYSGNHSLVITPSFQGVDDNPSNDALNRHYTVATCISPAHLSLAGTLDRIGVQTQIQPSAWVKPATWDKDSPVIMPTICKQIS